MNIFKFLFSKVDESSNDKLGAYPEKVHVGAMPERRYLKTSRIMALLSAGLLCVTIMLAFIIYLITPLLRSEPMLLAIDKRFYKLEPVQTQVVLWPASMLLMEEHIKQYILLRHTIVADIDEMQARWNEENSLLRWFSSTEAFGEFKAEKEVNMARMTEGLTTEVNVRFIHRIDDGLWLAEFDTIEHMPEEEFPVIKRWRALFEAGFKPRGYPNREERLKNPLNFFVNRYSLSSRSVTKEDKKAKFID